MRKSGVYKLIQKDTGKTYVGSTLNIYQRRSSHLSSIKRGTHQISQVNEDAKLYGMDSFIFEVIEFTSDDENVLDEKEQYWQKKLKPAYNVTNLQRPKAIKNRQKRIQELIELAKKLDPSNRPIEIK